MFRITLKLKNLFAMGLVVILFIVSNIYIGLFWSIILGTIFAFLCICLLFHIKSTITLELKPKSENIAIAVFLLATLIHILFLSDSNKNIFLFWESIYAEFICGLLLALLFPVVIGYITLRMTMMKSPQAISIFVDSFFVGTLISLISFLLMDIAGIPKSQGILFISFIMFLAKIIKDAYSKHLKKNIRIHIPFYALIIFVFAVAMYASVYLSSFLKGDLWKECAMASYIELNGLEKYLETLTHENIMRYPSLFMYFLASLATAFSIPLLNLAEALAILIPGFSVLAMLCYFSAFESKEHSTAKFAVLVWFLFSGWGMLYLLLKFGTFESSSSLAVTLMNKLGWGGGLVYSPSLGSFAHVVRLLSIVAIANLQRILKKENETRIAILLGFLICSMGILFHPLMAFLLFVFLWAVSLITNPKVASYLMIVYTLSYGTILVFDHFSATSLFFNNLAVLAVLIIAIVTVVTNITRTLLRVGFSISTNIRFLFNLLFKALLLTGLCCYVYALAILFWNYDKLFLDRFPTIPLYAWPYIMGLAGFLAFALLGIFIFKGSSPKLGERYFLIFAILVFFSSLVLDYNNVYQVVEIFDPNIISFRLIPIIAIPVSYLAGSSLYRIFVNTQGLPDIHLRGFKKFGALLLIILILGFMFTSTLPRVMFWMKNNWPSLNAEEYHVSGEEIALINYLRTHVSEGEFIAVEGGQASPLGQIVSLSGVKVISKKLADVLFQAQNIETINVLKETLNIRYITIKKSSSNYAVKPSYLEDILLKDKNPIFETSKYAIYEFPSLYVSQKIVFPDIHYPFHYGAFSETLNLSGEIKLKTELLEIEKLEINNLTLTDVKVAGNITLTLFNAEGNLMPSLMPTIYFLSFDGFDDYITVPNVITSKPFTVQFWVKLKSPGKSVILDSRDKAFASLGKGFAIVDSKGDGKYQVGLSDGSHIIWSDRLIDLSDLEWHNIAISVNDENMTIYFDGTIKQKVDISGINGSLFSVSDIKIGNGLAGYFNGLLGSFIIYNKTCTQEEIRFNMMSTRRQIEDGMVLAYTMDKETGTILYDSSGNGNNGVIYGCSWHLNGIEIRLSKPASMQLEGKLKILDGLDEMESISSAKIITSLILASSLYVEVNGSILLKDSRLTWPYIEKIGPPGDILLLGNIEFEVLNIHDLYIPMRLLSFAGFKPYYQDPARTRVVRFFTYHESILLYMPQLRDIYIILALFLAFSLGYILMMKIADLEGMRRNGS